MVRKFHITRKKQRSKSAATYGTSAPYIGTEGGQLGKELTTSTAVFFRHPWPPAMTLRSTAKQWRRCTVHCTSMKKLGENRFYHCMERRARETNWNIHRNLHSHPGLDPLESLGRRGRTEVKREGSDFSGYASHHLASILPHILHTS